MKNQKFLKVSTLISIIIVEILFMVSPLLFPDAGRKPESLGL